MLSALQDTSTAGRRPRPLPTSERPSTEGGRPLPTTSQRQPYGWRLQLQKQPDGTADYIEIPLTEEDFLDPQEGDHKTQNTRAIRCVLEIFDLLDNYYVTDCTTNVFFDLKMEWGIPGLKEPAPEIAVVPAMREKNPDLDTFKVLEQGTCPALVIEVMSPSYQGDNTVKVQLYQQAGIKEYLVVNPYHGDHRNHYHLTLYRLVGQQYQQIPPDPQGRFLSDTTGVFFHVSADHRQVLLTVAATGEKLLTANEEQQARLAAEAQVQLEAQARLVAEAKLQALEARLRELEAKPKKHRRR